MLRTSKIVAVGAMLMGLMSAIASAQPAGGPGGGGAGGGRGGGFGGGQFNGPNGQFDPAAFQTQMQTAMHQSAMDGLRQTLGATDDEFAALQPLLEKVISDQQAASVGATNGATSMRNMMQAGRAMAARNGGANGGPNGGPGGPNGPNGGPNGAGPNGAGPGGGPNPMAVISGLFSSPYGMPASDMQKQIQADLDDLNNALADQTTTPDTLRAKMDIFRNARAKASEQLAKDEAALSTVLTARQEAALLASGLVN